MQVRNRRCPVDAFVVRINGLLDSSKGCMKFEELCARLQAYDALRSKLAKA